MPLTIALEDEHGKTIEEIPDYDSVLLRATQAQSGDASSLLKYIDPYGDTTFNAFQAHDVSCEIDSLMSLVSPQDAAALKLIKHIADQCAAGIHLYMKIYGD